MDTIVIFNGRIKHPKKYALCKIEVPKLFYDIKTNSYRDITEEEIQAIRDKTINEYMNK